MWAKSAVRAILANPRYTGHQVWNKQRKDEVLIDVDDVALGHETKMRWNDTADVGLVASSPCTSRSSASRLFEAAQAMFDRTQAGDRAARRRRAGSYVLAGLLRCGICGRRMQGQWNHGRAYYRCKFPTTTRRRRPPPEERLRARKTRVDARARRAGSPRCSTTTTSTTPAPSSPASASPTRRPTPAKPQLRDQIADCDRKLADYRALLDAGEDAVTVAAKWIAEVERERKALERQLGRAVPGGKLTKSQVTALVEALRDIVDVLADADPEDKAAALRRARGHPDLPPRRTSRTSRRCPRGVQVRVGGGT